ncbi:hypothetical protein T03_13215 [Trichinella britovi]|uniref:Uncharacterized protein n=1 Tax=Trichinella britovi TaxID=45882 RepID=A0A0V1D570_TRIBR|nr:hypothetical protein T03_13215 [Trichinella britovi]
MPFWTTAKALPLPVKFKCLLERRLRFIVQLLRAIQEKEETQHKWSIMPQQHKQLHAQDALHHDPCPLVLDQSNKETEKEKIHHYYQNITHYIPMLERDALAVGKLVGMSKMELLLLSLSSFMQLHIETIQLHKQDFQNGTISDRSASFQALELDCTLDWSVHHRIFLQAHASLDFQMRQYFHDN